MGGANDTTIENLNSLLHLIAQKRDTEFPDFNEDDPIQMQFVFYLTLQRLYYALFLSPQSQAIYEDTNSERREILLQLREQLIGVVDELVNNETIQAIIRNPDSYDPDEIDTTFADEMSNAAGQLQNMINSFGSNRLTIRAIGLTEAYLSGDNSGLTY